MKKNCWEVMQCGREVGGRRATELGICPAATEERLDGTHHGHNAGRSCWIVAGTLCKGEAQGVFARKFGACSRCEFYEAVKKDEYPNFHLSMTLLAKLSGLHA